MVRPFVISSGPIAGWFGQPGQGTQYQSTDSVLTLIANGTITRVDIHDEDNAKRFEMELEQQRRRRRSLELDV